MDAVRMGHMDEVRAPGVHIRRVGSSAFWNRLTDDRPVLDGLTRIAILNTIPCMPFQPGSLLHDRYRIEGQLGKGGMGAVYLARDETLHIRVAVKENLNPNPESDRQFLREAHLLASLRHPNLPRVTDYFITEDRQYLVMDFIEGENLHMLTQTQRPTVPEVLRWADALCDALHFLHTRQPPIIHRDIKPANVKLTPDDAIVLVDFGIAKPFTSDQTSTGARGLTPGFSPPEQYGGLRTDSRSDQYALGATLYALLAGKPPADSIERMLHKETLRPIRESNPAVPPAVDAAIERALALEQDQRFPDMRAFKVALHSEVAEPMTVREPLPDKTVAATVVVPTPAAPSKPRSTTPWILFGGLGILGIGGVIVGLILLVSYLGGKTTTPQSTLSSAPPPATAGSTIAPTSEQTVAPPTSMPAATEAPSPTPSPEPTAAQEFPGGGGRIAFVSDREDGHTLQVWTMNPDGSDLRQLTFGPTNKTQPRWSPDGARILYVADGGKDTFGNSYGLDLWSINADGSGPSNLTASLGEDTDPAWSPDGTRIAFASDRINSLSQVFIMSVSCAPPPEGCQAGKPANFSAGFAVEDSPAWSPDGATLVVAADIKGAPKRIFFRPSEGSEGGEAKKLDLGDNLLGADHLRWSPDGKWILFTWVQRTTNELYLVEAVSKVQSPTKLTSTAGNKEGALSPDGAWIVFTSTRDQNPEIYLMPISAGTQENLTNSPGTRDMQPDWQPVPAP